jgi:hypothetical protein
MAHINTIIPDTLDLLQFAYRPNRSTDDTIFIELHTVLSDLDKRKKMRVLFIHYSSAFNTIVPSKLITQLRTLGLNTSPLQLDPGLPDVPPPGGNGRQQCIRHAHPQHGGPSGVCA